MELADSSKHQRCSTRRYHPKSFVMFLKTVLKYLSTTIRVYRCHDKGARALQHFQADMSKSIVHVIDRKIQ